MHIKPAFAENRENLRRDAIGIVRAEEALLTTPAYLDLNLVVAGMAKTPEESQHTSVKARVENCRDQGSVGAVVDQPADWTRYKQPLEDESFWLVPIEDRRENGGTQDGISAHRNLAS